MVGSLCRYCGGGLFAAVAQPAEEQQLQSEFLQGGLLHPENEAMVWGWRRQLGLVCTKGHQPSPHAAGKQNGHICRPLRLNFKFNQHSSGYSTELSAVFSAGTSHGVSSEFPWSYSQLSEIHVSVWPAATALHHPHGHWSACWHPHWGKYSSTIVAVDCKGSHEAVKPDPTTDFRPSTLYRRLSGAHKSTRTTLLLSMLPQIHRGRRHCDPWDINLQCPSDAKAFFFDFCLSIDRPLWCCSCPWWTRDNRLCFAVQSSTVSSVSSTRTRKARGRL